MSLYGHRFTNILSESAAPEDEELKGIDLKPFIEAMAYDDISRGTDEQIHEFCNSELAQVLQEKQVLNKPTMMRLDKASDQKRRQKLIVYQLAEQANDPAFKKMVFHRKKMKEYKAILMKKYGKKAEKIAAVSQREYIKAARKAPSTPVAKADKEEDK